MQDNLNLIVAWWLRQNIWHYLWIPVLVAISLSELVVCGMSLLLLGRIDNGYLMTGLVAAGLVSLFVCAVLFYLADRLRVITEREQQIAEALRLSDENLNLAQTVGRIGSWVLDIPSSRLEWSAETYRIFGIPLHEAIDQEDFLSVTHPDDRDFVMNAWGETMAGDTPLDIEHRIVVLGETRWVAERAKVERDSKGHPLTGIGTVQDITERKMAEKALAKSEERAQLAISASHLALWDYDIVTGSVYLSEGWSHLLGGEQQPTFTTIHELTGLVPEEDRHMVRAAILEAVKGHVSSSYQVTHRVRKLDGGYIWVLSEGHVIDRDRDGRALRMIGTNRDITERKTLEIALAESEERFRLIMETIDEVFWMADVPIGRVLYISPGYEHVWGRTTESLYENPRSFIEAIHPEDIGRVLSDLEAEKTGQPFDHEYRVVRPDGTIRWVCERGFPIRDKTGKVTRYAGVAQDITDRKQADRHLRDLTAYVQAVREEEKASIAREIHDDLGGALLTLKMGTHWLKTELSANGKDATQLLDHVQDMSQAIDHAADIMRNIITGLRPPILVEIGLLAALEWQAGHFQNRTGIKCRVNCIGDKGGLDKTRSIELFRISQEALSNVARHSGASSVEIEFLHNEKEVVMSIIDNGRGMTASHTDTSKHFGILGMRERVDQLNGRISFDTPHGGGFSVTVILPLPANDEETT